MGIGTFAITNDDYVFVNQGGSLVGYGVRNIPNCCDIIQYANAAYGTYNLQTSIGPIAFPGNNPSLFDWTNVPTSGGLMTVTSMTDNTFRAVVSPVPEPGTLSLLSIGALGLLLRRRL